MSLSHSAPVGTAAAASRDRRIVFNCGGVLSQISLALLQAHPHTLLAKLTSSMTAPASSSSYTHGDLFLDRDPLSFGVILNWYRYGKLLPPPNGSLAPEILADDIVYFKLPVVADAGQGVQAVAGYPTGLGSGSGGSTLGMPGLAKLHSYAFPGSSSPHAAQPLSRASSQFVEAREFPARNDDGSVPTLQQAPSLSHMGSINSPAAQNQYAQLDENGTTANNATPVVNILPPTPPMLSAANSVAAGPKVGASFVSPPIQPRFMHQISGSSGFPAPGAAPSPAAGYRALDSEDAPPHNAVPIISPTQLRAASTIAPQPLPVAPSQPALAKAATLPTSPATVPAAAAPVTFAASPVAAPAVTSPAAAPVVTAAAPIPASIPAPASAPAPAPVVRPRVPFDLAIEMLSCFKDVSRAEALALIDKAAVAKTAAGDYASATDAAAAASASSSSGGVGEDGSYLFRRCSESSEKLSDGSLNPDLFVLSYLHQRKMFNTKVWRVFLGRDNPIQAQTMQGYVLSEERAPNNKSQTHTSILTLTHAIIGPHAKAIIVE